MSFPVDKATELIEQAHDNGRLAHAYLIAGPPGSGKEALALRMIALASGDAAGAAPAGAAPAGARSLEEVRSSTTVVIGPESKSRRITIDAIRAVERTLQMAAAPGVTKFAVIKDADRMGAEAENAFLKTLEEPPPACRLLLLTTQPEMLFETILSRCIRLTLAGRPGPAEVGERARTLLEALKSHAMEGRGGLSEALRLKSAFAGILKEEKDAIAAQNEEAFKAERERYRQTTEGDYLKRREEYYKALTEAEYLERRNRLLDYLLMWFGDAMRIRHGVRHLDLPDYAEATQRLSQSHDVDDLSRRLEAVETLRSHLNTNVFETLALEVAFLRAFS